jgi:hypothetical protein
MPRPKIKLTDAAPGSPRTADGSPVTTVERAILADVRRGASPHAAAHAAGVDPGTWARWTDPARCRFRPFQRKLRTAAAQAQVRAQLAAFAANPTAWLGHRPDWEPPDSPGWAGTPTPLAAGPAPVNVPASPEWQHLWDGLLQSLVDFPDARAAVQAAVAALRDSPPDAAPQARRGQRETG